MKFYNLFLILCIGALTTASAQTTLSFTSRGDIASVFGYSNPPGLSSKSTKAIGTRASFGLELVKKTSGNQAFVAGLEYAISGFDFRKDLIGFTDTSSGIEINESKLSGAYRYDFIAMPFGYRWYRANEEVRLYAQGALVPMAYIRTISSYKVRGAEQFEGLESYVAEDFQTIQLAALTAIGIERTFFDFWTIGLQSVFRVHLTSVTNTEFKERPWTAGLQLNIGRQLAGNNPEN